MPTIRTEVKTGAVALLGLAFTVGYFSHFPLPDIFHKLFLIGALLLVLFSAYGYGATVLSWGKIPGLNPREFPLFATAGGLGIWSFILMAAGICGGWNKGAVVLLLAVGLGLGWRLRGKLIARRNASETDEPVPALPASLMAIGGALSLLVAFAPPTYYDTLVYHYALPQTYIQAGRWMGQTSLIYSAFPQALEMLWMLGMLLAGDTLANLLGWAVGALGVLAVYLYTLRFVDRRSAWWAAALLSLMPSYLLLAPGGYVDVGLTVFGFLSFYLLTLWTEERRHRLVVLAGVFTGLAIGCKYTGALAILVGIAILVKNLDSRNTKNTLSSGFIYAFTVTLVFLPWMIKNLHFVGNPVFPFLYKWGSKASPWDQAAAEGYFRALTEYSPRSLLALGHLLWEIAVGGLRFGGGMDILGDLGWGALFGLLPALWLTKSKPVGVRCSLLAFLVFFIPWGLSRPVLRFLLPVAPLLAVLSAFAFTQIQSNASVYLRRGAQCFLALLLCSNLELFFQVTGALGLYQVPLGVMSREDYLSKRLKYFRAAEFVNQLPSDALTYVVGDQCAYYYNNRVLVSPVFNKSPLSEWANTASSAQDLAATLHARGVTHLLINHTELQRLNAAYGIFALDSHGQTNWDTLLQKFAKPIHRDAHCEVFTLS